jgi:hypothetical protein
MFMAFKDIGKTLLQAAKSIWPSIAGNWLARLLEHRPQIVNAVAMIGVIMRPDHRIDLINAIVEKLIP